MMLTLHPSSALDGIRRGHASSVYVYLRLHNTGLGFAAVDCILRSFI
jgi:hypothetical protein